MGHKALEPYQHLTPPPPPLHKVQQSRLATPEVRLRWWWKACHHHHHHYHLYHRPTQHVKNPSLLKHHTDTGRHSTSYTSKETPGQGNTGQGFGIHNNTVTLPQPCQVKPWEYIRERAHTPKSKGTLMGKGREESDSGGGGPGGGGHSVDEDWW
ncbi:hypothetical protein Pmani_019137 [Petrolisthes manimaculis]|uniref:Uncharacterized protein n=1 Tax=Petrolisthes manimaculis TaxID=1843537 RepID=A0AAE1PIZ5_9EUCA|nr:hypothetical protein Pmani_019137 [Petrolisthes manimaculis]